MLHITYGSTGTFYVTTEEKRIDTSVASSKIRLLFKFTNDMDKRVVYAYGQSQVHNDAIRTYQRSTKVTIGHHSTENVFTGKVNFKPFGYYKYEVFEVSWTGAVAISAGNAPVTENDILPVASTHGIVQGKVEVGKLLISETVGSEQVSYTKYTQNDNTNNYLYTN